MAEKPDKGMDGRGTWRAVYASLWDDPDFQSLNSDERLILLNLRTGPLTNLPVIYHYYIEAIERQTGVCHDRIVKALDTLSHTPSDSPWITLEKGIVWVRKGLKYDPNVFLSNPKHLIAIKKILLSFPKLKIVKDFIDFYKLPIPYQIQVSNTLPNTPSGTVSDRLCQSEAVAVTGRGEGIKEEEKDKEKESEGKEKEGEEQKPTAQTPSPPVSIETRKKKREPPPEPPETPEAASKRETLKAQARQMGALP